MTTRTNKKDNKTGGSFLQILAQLKKEGKEEMVSRLWNLRYGKITNK